MHTTLQPFALTAIRPRPSSYQYMLTRTQTPETWKRSRANKMKTLHCAIWNCAIRIDKRLEICLWISVVFKVIQVCTCLFIIEGPVSPMPTQQPECLWALPNFTFVNWIHGGAEGAVEVFGELLHVGHGPDDAEAPRRVEPGRDAHLDRLVAVHRAPRVGRA